jgi:hypothetical protein
VLGVLGQQPDQGEVGEALAEDRDELPPPQGGEVALAQERARRAADLGDRLDRVGQATL